MKKRVLVINCGMMVSTYINVALKNNSEYEIWGASTYKNHGFYTYKNYIDDIPNMSESNFIEVLNQKIKEYNFKFIIAPHEDLILFLQENKEKINATIVSSNYDTALLCRYKSKTYEKLKNYDFIPKIYKKEEIKEFPVFIKKDNDQGSRHAYKIDNSKEFELHADEPDMIICEYLPGEELTVDCFTDKNRRLLFCNPRVADRIVAGIYAHTRRTKLTDEIKKIAETLNREINFRGTWFFQIKKDINGKFKLLEISSRLPSSFSLSRCLDVNLPLMALKDFDGQDVSFTFNDVNIEMDQQFFGRYSLDINYNKIYVDFETCFYDKIDTFFMMYLYQCVNKKIKINLLTQNKNIALRYLDNNKISRNLFDEIIEVDRNNIKDVLKNNTILLSNDDELKNIIRQNINGYNCFSNNILESLIDWRE